MHSGLLPFCHIVSSASLVQTDVLFSITASMSFVSCSSLSTSPVICSSSSPESIARLMAFWGWQLNISKNFDEAYFDMHRELQGYVYSSHLSTTLIINVVTRVWLSLSSTPLFVGIRHTAVVSKHWQILVLSYSRRCQAKKNCNTSGTWKSSHKESLLCFCHTFASSARGFCRRRLILYDDSMHEQ